MISTNQSSEASTQGKWISIDGLQNETLLLRREFDLDAVPATAPITVTTLGYFELFVNGKRVGEHILDPPVSNLSKRVFPVTHDVTEHLQSGRNCIALWLGRGWFRGYSDETTKPMRPSGTGPLPGVIHSAPVVRISLELNDSHILSGTEWRGACGPISETGNWRWKRFGGEIYDAGKERPGWSETNFDDSEWSTAVLIDVPPLAEEKAQVEPTRKLESYSIESFEEIEPGVYQGDTGICLTGWLELEFGELSPGQEITITYTDDVTHKRVDRYGQVDRYIARGSGKEVFSNRFNWHGFRWIRVEGAKPLRGKATLIGTDLSTLTSFSCSNERLNRIHAMVMHTLRCLTIGGIQVDCPHRERLGYGGDGTASLLSMLTHFDCRLFYPHWLQHWRDEQRPDGGLPHTAPAPYLAGGGPVWCGFPLSAAWLHYVYYGDKSILMDQYASVCKWFEYVAAHTQDGLLQRWPDTDYRNWYLGDWLPPEPVNPNEEESVTLVNNCFLVECFDRAAAIADLLDRSDEADAHRDRAAALRSRIHDALYHGGIYADGDQVDLAYPLLVKAVPEALRAKVFQNLVKEIKKSGSSRIGTGLVGTGVLLELLIDEGRSDLVAAMIDTDQPPGWGNMLARGETATGEDWAGKDTHIHNCFNQINAWFIRGLIGLKPIKDTPGFQRFRLKPQPTPGIDWAKAECRTEAGTISVHWRQEDAFHLDLSVPEGSEAEVTLPDGSEHTLGACHHKLICGSNVS